MKNVFRSTVAAAALVCAGLLAACHKDDTPTPVTPPSTPLQSYIAGDTSLSIFNSAITKAGDNSLYGTTDSVTVLIPTNDAFRAAGISAASISNMSQTAVDSLLKYHLVKNKVVLQNGQYTAFNTQLGSSVYGYGSSSADSIYFNGTKASLTPVSGSTATVYRLNAPLSVPAASTSGLIAADTSLTYFAEAVKRSGVNLNTSTGQYTILAPNNAAFIAAGYPTLASIDAADSAQLRGIVNYHILPNQYFTNNFTTGSQLMTNAEGHNITVGTSNGVATFTGTSNAGPVSIGTSTNRLAAPNTVVQNINGVLTY